MRRLLAWAPLLWVLLAGAARAATVAVEPDLPRRPLHEVEVLADPGQALSPAQAAAGRFRPATAADLNVGYSSGAFWLRFSLRNQGAAPVDVLCELFSSTDRADLYQVTGAGPVLLAQGGSRIPPSPRELPHRGVLFRLHLGAAEEVPYLLRLASADSIHLQPVLWSERAFAQDASTSQLFTGAYYGVMLVMVLYNLLLWFSLRDRAYLYYVLFQAAYALTQAALDRTAARYLWPGSPEWNARSEIVFAGLTVLGAAGFVREFLGLRRRQPRLARLLTLLSCGGGLLAAAGLCTSHTAIQQAGSVYVLAACLGMLAAGALAWTAGSPDAPIFLLACFGLLIGSAINLLTSLGILDRAPIQLQTPLLGSAAEAVLLSLGLAARVRRIRRERDRALEEGRARLLTLGRLAAGVVHEVGNPLNYLSGGAAELARQGDVLSKALAAIRARAADAPDLSRAEEALSRLLRAARLVQTGGERIRRVVEGLRAWGRAPGDGAERADLSAELDSALALCEQQLALRAIQVRRDMGSLPPVLSRRGQIGQVFLNLLLNSIQAMPEGGTIEVCGRRAGDRAVVTFRDSGPGVPAELRGALFEPFVTSRVGEGMGVGLTISRDLAAWNGGELQLLPEGPGAAFLLTLPLAPAPSTSTQG